MQTAAIARNWVAARLVFFRWRFGADSLTKAALAFYVACLTGVLAQVRIPLPWTLVPITGQTFAPLLAGVLLGGTWGGASQLLYIAIGAAGVPWFAGHNGGLACLAGPTAGYLAGFVLAASFVGHFTDRYVRARSRLALLGIMLFANFVLIYGPGILNLVLIRQVSRSGAPLGALILGNTLPFVPGDIIKILAAVACARAIVPKTEFGNERI